MNYLKRAALLYVAKTVEKSMPHATDEELNLQWERAQLNIRDATDPEAKTQHIAISSSIEEEMKKRGLMC